MTRSTVVTNHVRYTVSGLEPRARGAIVQALVSAQVVDALTGASIESASIRTQVRGLRARTASGGFVGLVGDPGRVLPALATTAYDVEVAIGAEGYLEREETVAFAVQPGFPATFDAARLGVRALHPSPVALRVGSYELDSSNRVVPLGAADVSVTGHWRSVADLPDPAATTALLAVAGGLSAPRPLGATLDVPTLSTPAEPARVLTAPVDAGTTRLPVSYVGALVVGDLVGLDLADPERAEWVEVVSVEGPADPLSPSELVLGFALRAGHAQHSPVQRILATPAAPSASLVAEAVAGDHTLVLSTLSGLGTGQVVRVAGGAAPAEFRSIARYELSTDSDGQGRFPPMTGVAAVAVTATSGGLGADARVTLTPPSSPAVDLTLT